MVDGTGQVGESPLFVFAGGGTGGHLYPALAVAGELRKRIPRARFLFFGTDRAIDQRIFGDSRYELVRQQLPPIRRAPWTWPQTVLALRRSSLRCRSRFENDRPAVVIGTGGLASAAPIREARRAGVPVVLLNPDAVPGRANRMLASLADIVFVQWAQTVAHFSNATRVQVTGCAIRPEFNTITPEDGRRRFDLDPSRKTLLVTGASQGAQSVNQAVIANIDYFESADDWQILHLTGDRDYAMVREAYRAGAARVRVLDYTDAMAGALAAADLVVARAGASSLAEITAVGRASILMPYPFHRDLHQRANARCLVRASAARIVTDRVDPATNGPALRAVLQQLMTQHEAREQMAAAARRIGRGDAACAIAAQILALAGQRRTSAPAEYLKRTT